MAGSYLREAAASTRKSSAVMGDMPYRIARPRAAPVLDDSPRDSMTVVSASVIMTTTPSNQWRARTLMAKYDHDLRHGVHTWCVVRPRSNYMKVGHPSVVYP